MRSLFTFLLCIFCISLFAQQKEQLFSRDPHTGRYDLPVNAIDIGEYLNNHTVLQNGPLADTCLSVNKIDATEIEENEALILWEKGDPETLTYIVRYKKLSASDYTYKIISDTSVLMSSLTECTEYVFGVSSVCIQDTSGFKQVTFRTDCAGKIVTESFTPADITPNPAGQTLYLHTGSIKMHSYNLSIFNSLGVNVYSKFVSNHASSLQINIADLPPGVYILQCRDQQMIRTGRFIRE